MIKAAKSKNKDENKEEDKKRIQRNVTLSERAANEFQEVADWLNMPLLRYLRQILETHHRSPSFANLLRRVRHPDQDGPPPEPPSRD